MSDALQEKDVEAIRWAVAWLEAHPAVQANENSRYWLGRLKKILVCTEDVLPEGYHYVDLVLRVTPTGHET